MVSDTRSLTQWFLIIADIHNIWVLVLLCTSCLWYATVFVSIVGLLMLMMIFTFILCKSFHNSQFSTLMSVQKDFRSTSGSVSWYCLLWCYSHFTHAPFDSPSWLEWRSNRLSLYSILVKHFNTSAVQLVLLFWRTIKKVVEKLW